MSLDEQLRQAFKTANLEKVKQLVEQGADVHIQNDLALRYSSYRGNLEVVKYLCEQGADIHAYDDEALQFASEYGHIEIVKYLEAKILQEKRIAGLEKLV